MPLRLIGTGITIESTNQQDTGSYTSSSVYSMDTLHFDNDYIHGGVIGGDLRVFGTTRACG